MSKESETLAISDCEEHINDELSKEYPFCVRVWCKCDESSSKYIIVRSRSCLKAVVKCIKGENICPKCDNITKAEIYLYDISLSIKKEQ